MSNHVFPESLVNTQWVADHIDDPHIRLIDVVRGTDPATGFPAYEGGHIPGAVAWDFTKDFQDPARDDVIDQVGLEALLSRSGITQEMTIVLYDRYHNLLAAYAFWLLKIYGHKDVRLIDGDGQKWLQENRPTTSQVPSITAATYQAREANWILRAGHDDVLRSIGQVNQLLVDARSAEKYIGLDKSGTARGGHIPGAINLAARQETNPDGSNAWRVPTVQPDGMFKSAGELEVLFESLGITPDKDIITYCEIGGLSSHAWFVLTQLLGYGSVREYDRSWAEWGNLEGAPIEP
ncbi:MAG: sulfurtransferase [Anaerolineales bacterium]